MKTLSEIIQDARPSLSPESVKTYTSILSSLHRKVFKTDVINIKDFDDSAKILKFLKDVKPNVRKTILSALFVITSNAVYRKDMLDDIKSYNEQESKQIKNEKQTESWVSTDDIKELYEMYKKNANAIYKKSQLTMNDLQEIQRFIILALLGGVFIPPRRSKDYVDFKISDIDRDVDNYMKGDSLVFNSYKTAKTYGRQVVQIPAELKRILKRWIEINPTDYLLIDTNGNKLTNVMLTHRLNAIFGGKKVSVNQLRHTYLSDKYQDTIKLQKRLAKDFENMGSSTLQEHVYIKALDV